MQKITRYALMLLSALCFFLLFLIQSVDILTVTPLHATPLLLLPFLVTFSMYREELTAALAGLAVGILMDSISVGSLGFHTVFFFLVGFSVSFILHFYFNNNLQSALLLSILCSLIYYLARWLIFFLLRGRLEDGSFYLFRVALPSLIYTNLFTVPFFFFQRAFSQKVR